ncbi:MAG: hypothetical protein WDN75_11600 [Bacteroidota bacterium]
MYRESVPKLGVDNARKIARIKLYAIIAIPSNRSGDFKNLAKDGIEIPIITKKKKFSTPAMTAKMPVPSQKNGRKIPATSACGAFSRKLDNEGVKLL